MNPTYSPSGGAIIPTSTSVYDQNTGAINAPAAPNPMPQSINSGILGQPAPITLPPPPTYDNGMATNASIPSPVSLIQQANAPTQAENTQQDILNRIAQIQGSNPSLATQQYGAENAAGVPALTKTVNDLGTRIEGLNNQATLLANNAAPGGTIENQLQNQSEGRGITASGLAPLQSGALRNNQIQQAGIASQALTLKSAYYAAQGNLSLAKDAADKAAQVKFDAVQQQLNAQKAQLDAIAPQLTKDQQARADLLKTQLNDRQNQITFQREDFKTGQAAIADALKNNPTNAQAHEAAKMAASLDPTDPHYLQKVQQLVAPYATDQTMRALDIQAKRASIAASNASVASSQTTTALNRIQLKSLQALQNSGLGDYAQTTSKGGAYVNTDNIADAKTKAAVQAQARRQGIPVLDKTGAAKLQAIDDTRTNLQNIQQSFSQFAYPNAAARDTIGLFGAGKRIKDFFQSDSNISSFKSWRTAAINSIQALAGGAGSGLRINQAEIDAAIHNDIPDISDTAGTGAQKIANLGKQLDSWEAEMLKPTAGQQSSQASYQIQYQGKTYNVDSKGNMTPS